MQKSYLKYVILVVCLLIVAGYLISRPDISVETILAFAPGHPVITAAVILLLYAVKSIIVFFPLIVLEIAAGHLFPLWTALAINLTGILLTLTIPYWTGRAISMQAIQKLEMKYPLMRKIVKKQQENEFFLCVFLRIISCLPRDVITMYMGATHTPFWKNIIGGTLGISPGMVLVTILGSSIREPGSPAFWISAALTVTLSVVTVLLYRSYQLKEKDKS